MWIPTTSNPARLPGRHERRHREPPVVLGDVGAQEAAHPVPRPATGEQAGHGKDAACVEPPRRPPEGPGRDQEVQAGHGPARADDPGQFPQRVRRIVDVAQQVREGQGVEAGVRERQLFGPAGGQRYALGQPECGEPAPPPLEHAQSEVGADHRARRPGRQLHRHSGGTRGHIQDPRRGGGHDLIDHGASPPAVLTQRQDFGEQVVPLGQWREQLLGDAVPVSGDGHLDQRASQNPPGFQRFRPWRARKGPMTTPRFDVLVVGAGPAGSVAAMMLARAGARVALLDKAAFPRDKACGDLIGPRGVQLLDDLGLPLPGGPRLGPMVVVGPTGRRVGLPSAAGLTYPGYGVAARRADFDAALQGAAGDAGAVCVKGRAEEPLWSERGLEGFHAGEGSVTSRLRDRRRRCHQPGGDPRGPGAAGASAVGLRGAGLSHPEPVEGPVIAMLETAPWQAFPGYGWVFPGADGGANASSIGIATGQRRQAGSAAARALPAFLTHLRRLGLWDPAGSGQLSRPLGGWLKMGMVGTSPAAGRVCWPATPPAWSTPCRVRASPRPCAAGAGPPKPFSLEVGPPRTGTGPASPPPICPITGSRLPCSRRWWGGLGPPPSWPGR